MSQLLDKTTSALSTALNMRLLRHNLTSTNIANAETPGFKAKKLDFEDALARAVDIDGLKSMSTSNENHFNIGNGPISSLAPEIYDDPDGALNNDNNSVDMEKEMANMAENNIMYRAALQLINKKLAALKYAAQDGR
jgi:flagellar basal-body rod protein FlgB